MLRLHTYFDTTTKFISILVFRSKEPFFFCCFFFFFFFFSLQVGYGKPSLSKDHSIQSLSFSLIKLCGKVVSMVEKSYVDKLVARNPLNFNLLITSPEFLVDQKEFRPDLS